MNLTNMSDAELDVLRSAVALLLVDRTAGKLSDFTAEQHKALDDLADGVNWENWARGNNVVI